MGRIAQATLAAGAHGDGFVVFNDIITTSVFPRLSRVASAYQRFRFTKLDFNVQPMCPSTTGGGYVAGFLKDPLDRDTSFDALQGSHGAVVAKWWEHKTVQVRPPKDLLWTSPGENARLFSPGKFALTTVGTNTDAVNVSVLCHWEAELSVPSLEEVDAAVSEYITSNDLLETVLVSNLNEIHQRAILDATLANGTILACNQTIGIDYKLGAGDVTKATYNHFRVNVPSVNFGSDAGLQWGVYAEGQSGGLFTPGSDYYSDNQPQQVILPKGSIMQVIHDPNA